MTSWINLRAAIHALELDESAWIDGLFDESRRLFDAGRGLFAYSYRVDRGSTIRLGSVAGIDTAPAFWRALFRWGASNQRSLARIYQTGAGSLEHWMRSGRRARAALSEFEVGLERCGPNDLFTIVGHMGRQPRTSGWPGDATGFGVFLTLPRARREPAPTAKQRRAFEHLAAELAVAARLREHQRQRHVARLSAAEQQVARRLVEGAPDKAIALDLGVSLSTVSTFARRVRSKLGCRPGEELLLLAGPARRCNVERRLELFERLTASECDVAAELLVGASYAEIADRRGVSIRTVASQCAAVFRKCSVSGRRELVATLSGK